MARNNVTGDGYSKCLALVTSDTVPLAQTTDAIFITTAGNIAFIDDQGNATTVASAPVGIYPICVALVKATGTTATVSALYF